METNPKKYSRILEDTIKQNDALEENNYILKISLVIISLVIITVIIFLNYNGQSEYERGDKYLQQKQYEQAKAEFEMVKPEEKEFNMARSKINYINGINTYENGDHTKALFFLRKVEPSDEYFEESKLIIEKISMSNNISQLEALKDKVGVVKDTVIIKEENLKKEEVQLNKSEAEPSSKNNSVDLPYVLEKLYIDFENIFRIAENKPADEKKNYLYLMDSMYISYTKTEIYKDNDPDIKQINNIASSWMQNRIELLSKSINIQRTANSNYKESKVVVKTKNELLSLKEKGDNLYSSLQLLIKNNNN